MRRKLVFLSCAAALVMATGTVAVTQAVQAASPATSGSCSGSPQRCDVTFQSVSSGLYLGNNGGRVIVFYYDGLNGQRWDVYQLSGNEYVIYNHGTNNVVALGPSCTINGGTYKYCAVIQPQGSPIPRSQIWSEVRTDPMVFENEASGGRCLDAPGGNPPAGTQVVLYPCNGTDYAQQWIGS
jgi:hypothetical protein